MLAFKSQGVRLGRCQAMKDRVAQLAPITSVASVKIPAENWTIPNVEGKKASVAIYAHLATKYGKLNPAAAKEGLELYDEVVADAVQRPGAHPNIDLLFKVIDSDLCLDITIDHQ